MDDAAAARRRPLWLGPAPVRSDEQKKPRRSSTWEGQGDSVAVVGMVVVRAQRQVAALFCARRRARQLLTLAYARAKISAQEGG